MKKIITFIILIIFSLLCVIFINNNYFMYEDTIIKVMSIDDLGVDYDYNDLGIKEMIFNQKIQGVILNGKSKGTHVTYKYQYYKSQVATEKYRVNDKLIIKDNAIDGLKRDSYVLYMILIFIIAIYLIGNRRGLLTLVSVITNCIFFYIDIYLYIKGINITLLCLATAILFTIISLVAAAGINKKTISAVLSVFICLLVLFAMIELIAFITGFRGVNFNILNYLTVPPEEIFVASLLIGGLGAIMDVSITISSSVSELIETSPNISNKQILDSSRAIGSDIMPTMISVLFFTYFCQGLPTFVLAIRNGFTVSNYLATFYTLDITRFLCGSIGICLAVVISTYISITLFKRGDMYE